MATKTPTNAGNRNTWLVLMRHNMSGKILGYLISDGSSLNNATFTSDMSQTRKYPAQTAKALAATINACNAAEAQARDWRVTVTISAERPL